MDEDGTFRTFCHSVSNVSDFYHLNLLGHMSLVSLPQFGHEVFILFLSSVELCYIFYQFFPPVFKNETF